MFLFNFIIKKIILLCILMYRYNNILFECLFYVRSTDFSSLFKVRIVMGALIVTSIEHIEKSFRGTQVSNQGPLNHMPAALNILPIMCCCKKDSDSDNNNDIVSFDYRELKR